MSNYERLDSIVEQVRALDPELVELYREGVELGAQFILEVTDTHGTPENPRWNHGPVENTLMAYHNGEGENASAANAGHTSAHPDGAGVPANTLVIARAINEAAGDNTIPVKRRLRNFQAACAHDLVQGGERSTPKGDRNRGDENLSAIALDEALKAAGYDQTYRTLAVAALKATMIDMQTHEQAVDYTASPDSILDQEILAASDVFSTMTNRGPLSGFEVAIEHFGLNRMGNVLQQRLTANGLQTNCFASMEDFLAFAQDDKPLHAKLVDSFADEVQYHQNHTYSDRHIRDICNGKGIDELFAGQRERTVQTLERVGRSALSGQTLTSAWRDLQEFALTGV